MRLPLLLTAALLGSGFLAWAAAPAGLHPVVLLTPESDAAVKVTSGLLLGAFENGKWLTGKAIAGRLPKTLSWRVQALNGQSQVVSSTQAVTIGEAPCENTGFLDIPAATPFLNYRLATSPALNTRPRPVDVLPVNSAPYRNIVRAELVRRGLPNPVVNITSIARADLDGDGKQEVILAASSYGAEGTSPLTPPPHAGRGDYSLLLLRWVRNNQAQTTVLGQSVFTRDEKDDTEWQMPTLYDLGGIADLNGDGRMELIVTDAYYEGSGAAVLEWTPAGGLKERLNEGCGA